MNNFKEKKIMENYNLNILGEGKKHDVWSVNINKLYFNISNGRIFNEMNGGSKKNLSIEDFKNDVLQNKAYNCFLELYKNEADYKKIYKELHENGQSTPIVVTQNGIVVDGNTRLFIFKKLLKDKKIESEIVKLNAIILEGEHSPEKIERLETNIQFQFTNKIEYSPINRSLKWRSMYQQNIESGMAKNKAYKNIIQHSGRKFNIKDISEAIEILNYMEEKQKNSSGVINYKFLNNKNGHFTSLLKAKKYMKKFDVLKNKWNKFEEAALSQINNSASLIGSFRKIMPTNDKNSSWIKDDKLFYSWVNDSVKANTQEELDMINYQLVINNKDMNGKKKDELIVNNISQLPEVNKNASSEAKQLEFAIKRIYDIIQNSNKISYTDNFLNIFEKVKLLIK